MSNPKLEEMITRFQRQSSAASDAILVLRLHVECEALLSAGGGKNAPWEKSMVAFVQARDEVLAKYDAATRPLPFIPHDGGEMPIDRMAVVSCMLRDGTQSEARLAGDFDWYHDGSNGDVVSFYVHIPAPQSGGAA